MNRNVMIAAGVFVALVLLFFTTREKTVSVGIKKLAIPNVDKEKVTAFEVTGAKTATIRKEGNGWVVSDPAKPGEKFAADDTNIKNALDSLSELKAGDHVSDATEKHAEYEVDDAKGLRVKIIEDKGPVVDVVFGKFAKGGGSYIKMANAPGVFTTKARLGSLMRRDVAMWRKRQLVTVKADEFRTVNVKLADGSAFTMESADGKEWKLKDGTVTPAGFRFDAQAAARLATNLTTLRAQEFLDNAKPEHDAALGFSGAHAQVEGLGADGKALVSVQLGVEPDARDASQAGIIKNNFDAIDSAKNKDAKITAEDIEAALADKSKAEDVKKALEYVKTPATFARYDTGAWGFKAADQGISMEDLDSMVKVGSLVPLRVAGDSQTYLVSSWSAQQLTKKVGDYRDLTLVNLDVDKVKKLTINTGKPTVVEKKNGIWSVVEPKNVPADLEFDGSTVTSQLTMLKSVRASRLVEGVTEAQAGLNKPTGTVEAELEDGTRVGLRFGKETTNDKGAKEVYVRGTVDNFVYAVGEYAKKRYDVGVEIFRKPKPPPQMGGMGGMQGLDGLPPDVRKKLEAQLRAQK